MFSFGWGTDRRPKPTTLITHYRRKTQQQPQRSALNPPNRLLVQLIFRLQQTRSRRENHVRVRTALSASTVKFETRSNTTDTVSLSLSLHLSHTYHHIGVAELHQSPPTVCAISSERIAGADVTIDSESLIIPTAHRTRLVPNFPKLCVTCHYASMLLPVVRCLHLRTGLQHWRRERPCLRFPTDAALHKVASLPKMATKCGIVNHAAYRPSRLW